MQIEGCGGRGFESEVAGFAGVELQVESLLGTCALGKRNVLVSLCAEHAAFFVFCAEAEVSGDVFARLGFSFEGGPEGLSAEGWVGGDGGVVADRGEQIEQSYQI